MDINYIMIPSDVLASTKISSVDKLVYAVLHTLVDPDIQAICNYTGITRRTALRSPKRLVNAGFINFTNL